MIVMMQSSVGGCWTFFASAGDKVFLVETKSPDDDKARVSMEEMVRECRWLFGDRRIVYMNREDDWMEIYHNGAGHITGFEPYDGPVPVDFGENEQ
jgi:hypothetical protein